MKRPWPPLLLELASAAALAIGTVSAASAASGDADWSVCQSERLAASARIAACSAVISDPRTPRDILAEALWVRAGLLSAQGDHQAAIDDLNRSLELIPNAPGALTQRGNQFLFLHDYDRAFADFDQAVRIAPNSAIVFMQRGIARRRMEDFSGAVADHTEAIRLDPNLYQAFYNRGISLGLLGETDRAMIDFDEAIRLNSNYARGYSGRCWVRTLTHEEPRRGIADCDRALQLMPGDPTALDNRGFLHLLLNDNTAAYEDYDDAFRADPNYAPSLYGRGLARVRLGQRELGEADMQAAEEMDPTAAETFASIIAR